MKIIKATIYSLKIPLVMALSHYLKKHVYSDSIVVKLETDNGITGYGEGVARKYVTGETAYKSVNYIKKIIIPLIMKINFANTGLTKSPEKLFKFINDLIPEKREPKIIAWNASRSAVELALFDCILKNEKKAFNKLLPTKKNKVIYTAVITSDNLDKVKKLTKKIKIIGFRFVKIKVKNSKDIKKISAVRKILGKKVSIRLDANGAFSVKQAIEFNKSVEQYNIAGIEQPIPRGDIKKLSTLKKKSSIAIIVDESIVTYKDAEKLIKYKACDYFNLRITKCGGIYNTLKIIELAKKNNIKIQIGCLVGETAILSSAGRQLAASLPEVDFLEGSYGTHILTRDIARKKIMFGYGGKAKVLKGKGLGINVKDNILEKFSKRILCVKRKN